MAKEKETVEQPQKKAYVVTFDMKCKMMFTEESEEKALERAMKATNNFFTVGEIAVKMPDSKYGYNVKEVTDEVEFFMRKHSSLN